MESVLDVGCGDGRWLAAFQARGASTISGVDGPWTDREQLLISPENVEIKDLSEPFNLGRLYSLALSLEVAEHIGEEFSGIFVDNLVRHSDVILFSAAIPYQGGFRHVNEQWQSYWARLFEQRGFTPYDPLRSQIWEDKNVHPWYRQNIILYANARNANVTQKISRYIANMMIHQLPLDIVHPEKYEAIASYEQVAFKPLIRRLPSQTLKKCTDIVFGRT